MRYFEGNQKKLLDFFFYLAIFLGLILLPIQSRQIASNSEAYGIHSICMIIPFILSILYVLMAIFIGEFNINKVIHSIGLFLVLCIPFYPYFSHAITHVNGDDAYRYSIYANSILKNNTLWGSGGILGDLYERYKGSLHYIDQPGYRYWLALTIKIFNGETRLMQIFNLGFYLSSTLQLLCVLQKKISEDNLRIIAIFISLSSPYAAKNILMGLPEWFSISLFFMFISLFLTNKYLLSIIVLSLIPFVRQNLFPVSGLLAICVSLYSRRLLLFIVYLLIALLPLYHNVYYAGEFKLLVDNRGNYLNYLPDFNVGILFKYFLACLYRVAEYFGYDPRSDLSELAFAWCFVPLGTWFVFSKYKSLPKEYKFISFIFIFSVILPTFIFGYSFYPRFIYVNQTIMLVTLLSLSSKLFSNKLLRINLKTS